MISVPTGSGRFLLATQMNTKFLVFFTDLAYFFGVAEHEGRQYRNNKISSWPLQWKRSAEAVSKAATNIIPCKLRTKIREPSCPCAKVPWTDAWEWSVVDEWPENVLAIRLHCSFYAPLSVSNSAFSLVGIQAHHFAAKIICQIGGMLSENMINVRKGVVHNWLVSHQRFSTVSSVNACPQPDLKLDTRVDSRLRFVFIGSEKNFSTETNHFSGNSAYSFTSSVKQVLIFWQGPTLCSTVRADTTLCIRPTRSNKLFVKILLLGLGCDWLSLACAYSTTWNAYSAAILLSASIVLFFKLRRCRHARIPTAALYELSFQGTFSSFSTSNIAKSTVSHWPLHAAIGLPQFQQKCVPQGHDIWSQPRFFSMAKRQFGQRLVCAKNFRPSRGRFHGSWAIENNMRWYLSATWHEQGQCHSSWHLQQIRFWQRSHYKTQNTELEVNFTS